MMTRRSFGIKGIGTLIGAAVAVNNAKAETEKGRFEVTKTPEEWRKILTPEQYHVLREHGTERARSSRLDKTYDPGVYKCAGCDQDLYSSEHKFDSGTGWPSFYQPISQSAVGTSTDKSWFMVRTEVHCSRCGGHLGHIFDDGPAPTGLRHCINGVAMKFVPKTSS
ncbi:MAG: peptide-methionine (R)-S-oxide reductase MsrB [Hyphomicrobiaceae bacterium]|nr:peptide-methionine (R)-S-oxide reductase MsrB [Hyphomicrobiaceae bacterium]